MKQSVRLSSAVFQLTPTRTRCDLIIIANDKKEKMASGLLNPFLAHLKTAQDQMARGGYSIFLVPEKKTDAEWFTKATLERFVRFVSTPEILERVYTIETEIIQIEEAITLQRKIDAGEISEEHGGRKSVIGYEGGKSLPTAAYEEKAIVLYTAGETIPETKEFCLPMESSRVQLLKVLEARKTVLQKEQGMAFARAVAAGFDSDCTEHLVSFANCFGALRLMKACSRFIDLWKSKHETGQWLNVQEALAYRSDVCEINSSSIIMNDSQIEHDESNHELTSENNGKSAYDNNSAPNSHQEYQGQYPRIIFPPWPVHAPAGPHPVFPAYPPQGMPYCHTYTGSSPFFQPHNYPMEHFSTNHGPNSGHQRQSSDAVNSYTGPGKREVDRGRFSDGVASDEEVSYSKKQNKRTEYSNKKPSAKVVIQNINYVAPKVKKADSETDSDSQADIGGENEYYEGTDAIHLNKRSSKNGGSHVSSDNISTIQKDGDNKHWLAFQDCLLRGSEEGHNADSEIMFAIERDVKLKKCKNTVSEDPLTLAGDRGEMQSDKAIDMHRIIGSASHNLGGSGDEFMLSSVADGFRGNDDQMCFQVDENSGRKILYKTAKEDFMIKREGDQTNFRNSFDPLTTNDFVSDTKRIDRGLHRISDESLAFPFRPMSLDQVGETYKTAAIDIDFETPAKSQKLEFERNMIKANYEANDLSLMPERETDKRSNGYDIGLEYEMLVAAQASDEKGKGKITDVRRGLCKSDKNRRSMASSDPLHKLRTGGSVTKPSMASPLKDARIRAERLRSYKADLQKMKKEKEEAEARRLEFLKLERQNRIAARVRSTSVKPSVPSPQTKLPRKLSHPINRGSKFSDSEPGSSSPLQRSKIRIPVESSETYKTFRGSKLDEGTQKAGSSLLRSSLSLSETKQEKNCVAPDSKASLSRIRRLSEPKIVGKSPVTIVKARSAETILMRKLLEGAEMNKVSAIINLDRCKAETLPELKIKATPKPHIKSSENNSKVTDKLKIDGEKPSVLLENAETCVSTCNTSHQIDADDNPIFDKTVLVLERERPSLPTVHSSEGMSWSQQPSNYVDGEKSNMTSEAATLHASLPSKNAVDKIPIIPGQKQSGHNEIRTIYTEKEPPDCANIKISENSYRAPYARVSSMEDPCTHQIVCGKAPQGSTEIVLRAEKTVKTPAPDVKIPKIVKNQVHSDKISLKGSPKGFIRLLRFGKRNHNSSIYQSIDSECTGTGGIEQEYSTREMASTSEVDTLKKLISEDETSTAGNAPQKSTRHLSLFSHFWGKTSENRRGT